MEHLNRESSFVCHRAKPNSGCKRGQSDTYGCVRFEPQLPPEKTADTIESKHQRLQDIYSHEGTGGVERAEVKTLMETTFCILRQQLNSIPAPSVIGIRNQWPYLFHQKSICAHFRLLTDIDVLNAFEMSMTECEKAIEYFKNKSKNEKVKDVLSQSENTEMAHLHVKLLMSHFQEPEDGMVLHANVFSFLLSTLLNDIMYSDLCIVCPLQVAASTADVEKILNLPASPRLILLG